MYLYLIFSKLAYHFAWFFIAIAVPVALYFTALAIKQLAREIAIDAIEVYNRWQAAKADTVQRRLNDKFAEDSRRVKLSVWQREARQRLTQQRTVLQLGSEAMWKMGVFDVEID